MVLCSFYIVKFNKQFSLPQPQLTLLIISSFLKHCIFGFCELYFPDYCFTSLALSFVESPSFLTSKYWSASRFHSMPAFFFSLLYTSPPRQPQPVFPFKYYLYTGNLEIYTSCSKPSSELLRLFHLKHNESKAIIFFTLKLIPLPVFPISVNGSSIYLVGYTRNVVIYLDNSISLIFSTFLRPFDFIT